MRSRRPALSIGLLVPLALLLALAWTTIAACLPDLAPFTVDEVADSGIEGSIAPFVGCGDGLIATLDDGGDAGESCDPGHGGDAGGPVPGCVSCQVTCEGKLDPLTNHCYFVAGSDNVITDARGRCAQLGAHVVTFVSTREADLVATLPGIDPDAGFWVGLTRLSSLADEYGPDHPEEPGFPVPPGGPCDGCFGIGALDGGDDEAGAFPPEDAAVMGVPQNCLVSRGGPWEEIPCRGDPGPERTTVCEREPVGERASSCIGGYCFNLAVTAGQKTYVVITSTLPPDQAAKSCVDLGGTLVVFDTAEEREELVHEILPEITDPNAQGTDQQLWIGVVNDAGTWTWEDGQPISARPSPWGNAQPADVSAGDRGYMRLTTTTYDTQLAYSDNGALTPRLYICQRAP